MEYEIGAVSDVARQGFAKRLKVKVGPAAESFKEASAGGDNGACAPRCLVDFSTNIKLAVRIVNSHQLDEVLAFLWSQ